MVNRKECERQYKYTKFLIYHSRNQQLLFKNEKSGSSSILFKVTGIIMRITKELFFINKVSIKQI